MDQGVWWLMPMLAMYVHVPGDGPDDALVSIYVNTGEHERCVVRLAPLPLSSLASDLYELLHDPISSYFQAWADPSGSSLLAESDEQSGTPVAD